MSVIEAIHCTRTYPAHFNNYECYHLPLPIFYVFVMCTSACVRVCGVCYARACVFSFLRYFVSRAHALTYVCVLVFTGQFLPA